MDRTNEDDAALIITAEVPVIAPAEEAAVTEVVQSEPTEVIEVIEPAEATVVIEPVEPVEPVVMDVPLVFDRAPSMLRVVDLSAWYDTTKVLQRVSFDAPAGLVTAIVGPPGSGKTTLLRIINRLHERTAGARSSGQVLLDEADVYARERRAPDVRRRIGMIFPDPSPFAGQTVSANLLAALRLTGVRVPRAGSAAHVERALRLAGLWHEVEHRLDVPAGRLSPGEQQRLCLARALIVEPDVLLLDDPFTGLDPMSVEALAEAITRLSPGLTVVLATRDEAQVVHLAEQIVHLELRPVDEGADAHDA